MTIQKATITTLHHTGETYTVVPSSTINMIKNPDAIAILVYLLDRPTDWTVRREDIRRRFGLGRDRHDNAMRELKELGLAWRDCDRNELGHITEWKLCVSASPRATQDYQKPKNPRDGKPDMLDKPTGGETDHLHTTDLLHITERSKDGPAIDADPDEGPRKLRPDFQPTPETIKRAQQLGYLTDNPAQDLAEFIDYFANGNGSRKRRKPSGWQTSFVNWLRRTVTQQNTKGNTYRKPPTASDILAADLERALQL